MVFESVLTAATILGFLAALVQLAIWAWVVVRTCAEHVRKWRRSCRNDEELGVLPPLSPNARCMNAEDVMAITDERVGVTIQKGDATVMMPTIMWCETDRVAIATNAVSERETQRVRTPEKSEGLQERAGDPNHPYTAMLDRERPVGETSRSCTAKERHDPTACAEDNLPLMIDASEQETHNIYVADSGRDSAMSNAFIEHITPVDDDVSDGGTNESYTCESSPGSDISNGFVAHGGIDDDFSVGGIHEVNTNDEPHDSSTSPAFREQAPLLSNNKSESKVFRVDTGATLLHIVLDAPTLQLDNPYSIRRRTGTTGMSCDRCYSANRKV